MKFMGTEKSLVLSLKEHPYNGALPHSIKQKYTKSTSFVYFT